MIFELFALKMMDTKGNDNYYNEYHCYCMKITAYVLS